MRQMFELEVAAKSIGLEPDRASDHITTLKEVGFVDRLTFGGTGMLTARALAEAERLTRCAEQAAELAPLLLSVAERAHLETFVGVQLAAAGAAREAVRRRGEACGRHRKRPAGDLGHWRPTCRSGFNDHVARELAFRQGLSSSRGQRSGETHIPCNSGGARRFAGITRIYSPAGWRSRSGKPNGSFAGATSRVTAHSMNPATPTCCSRSPMSKPRAGTPLSRVEHRTPGPNDAATRGNDPPISAYLWSVEPSRVEVLGRGWSGPEARSRGASKRRRLRSVTLLAGSWLVKASGGLRSGEGSR